MEISTERLLPLSSGDDDSDVDLVTDYLITNSNSALKNYSITTTNTGNNNDQSNGNVILNITPSPDNKLIKKQNTNIKESLFDQSQQLYHQQHSLNNLSGLNQIQPLQQQHNNINSNSPLINISSNMTNMLPIISITPHSPGAKYYSILEESINHLQNVRDSVVHMKNSSEFQTMARRSLSLPDLAGEGSNSKNSINLSSEKQCSPDLERRTSLITINNEASDTGTSRKSTSLTNLDDQEPNVTSEKRTKRINSAVGISTHSLNEAELAGDFLRIQTKRNLTPAFNFYRNLRKSVSTSSISPRIPAKEENPAVVIRHLSDSDDDNQDDRTLLCVTDKTEADGDQDEKRRKRGSFFFGKKKDKAKSKESKIQSTPLETISSKTGASKRNTAGYSTHHHDDGRDYYDGTQNEHSNCSNDAMMLNLDFSNEPPIELSSLSNDPILDIGGPDLETWTQSVSKDTLQLLTPKEIKRQEHMYEFIQTEKHHCQTLLIIEKVFCLGIKKYFKNQINLLDRFFPKLKELLELHINFLKRLKIRQSENEVVNSIADILNDFFSGKSGKLLKIAYGEFCANHNIALGTYRDCIKNLINFEQWHNHCMSYPSLRKKGISESILFVQQRMTKYPLLVDPLIKSSIEREEQELLNTSMENIRDILNKVNDRVAEQEKTDRQLEIFIKLDVKSSAIYKDKKFRKSDICTRQRKLKFEGTAIMQKQQKLKNITVVVLTDCLLFLQDSSQNKYTFFTPENKDGVVPLKNLLVREKAGAGPESKGTLFLLSSNLSSPEMYELRVQNPKDVNIWVKEIKEAVSQCPNDDEMEVDEKQVIIREIIDKLREKDLEQALILEDKIKLQISLLKEKGLIASAPGASSSFSSYAEEFLKYFGTYKDLITDDCDTLKVYKRVYETITNTSQLAAVLYSAATGIAVSRSTSSVGEKQSDAYASPTLPKRAETFGGFDEKRNKNLQWRDAVLSTLPIQKNDNEKKFDTNTNSGILNSSSDLTISSLLSVNNNLNNYEIDTSLLPKETKYGAIQVQISENLYTILCIISQQMTTIEDLHSQLATIRLNKTTYKYNDQLEELRNLQDKFQEEKQIWLKEKEQKEMELEERSKSLNALKEQIKAEQEDIKQQREQIFKKMKLLSNQGILLSPNTPLSLTNLTATSATTSTVSSGVDDNSMSDESNVGDKRKGKFKPVYLVPVSSVPPVNLLSATNATKANQTNIKQQIPMKLSSLSSTKSDKTPISSNTITTPISASGGITQMLPLKLADKKANQNIIPSHSRTGSSPAIIQQPSSQQFGNPAIRTNTYPKLPDKYKVRASDTGRNNSIKPSTANNQNLNNNENDNNFLISNDIQLNTSSSSLAPSTRSGMVYRQKCVTNKSSGAASVALPSNRAAGITSQKSKMNNYAQSSSSPTSAETNNSTTDNSDDKNQQQQNKSSETDEEEIYF